MVVIFGGSLVYSVVRGRRRAAVLSHGQKVWAIVVTVAQTDVYVYGRPQMQLVLRLDEGGMSRDITTHQVLDMGKVPRPGDKVWLVIDTTDPSKIEYLGPVNEVLLAQSPVAVRIQPEMIGKKGLRVGTVLSSGRATMQVELDSVTEARRTVTVMAAAGDPGYTAGHRVYVMEDGQEYTAVPLALTGGRPLALTDARLEVLVLGPQLLYEGLKASGEVLEARQTAIGAGFMREQGRQSWFLRFRVTPADGSAGFETQDTLVYSSAEKVARICHVGAVVPMRYAPNDRMVITTDAPAMGYPDPFQLQCELWNQSIANGTVNDL